MTDLIDAARDIVSLAPPLEPDHLPTIAAIEIVLPVHNEQAGLARSLDRLHRHVADFPFSCLITIADNASTDDTWHLALDLASRYEGVRAVHLDQKGRGRALRTVWAASTSPVVAYMDIDLSTDLAALLPLVAPLVSGHSDIAIGSRLASGARVARGPKREAISRAYNLLLRTSLHAGFSDAQCGFKACRTDRVRDILPMVEDNGWFFDTELLVLAEHNGLRIHEVPVDWVDDPDSRVHVVSTARADLAGIWRMMNRFARGEGSITPVDEDDPRFGRPFAEQLVRFASIGVTSSIAFALLFLALHGVVGPYVADVVALLVCTVGNTAANRRLTFALNGRGRPVEDLSRALAVGAIPLVANLIVLVGLGSVGPLVAVGVLTLVNAGAGIVRFALLDRWVFRSRG